VLRLHMAQFGLVLDAFDKAYREAILQYTKHHMTALERKVFQSLIRCNRDMEPKSGAMTIEQVIDQFRNVDPEGWMVYKSAFVEDYVNNLSNERDHICLCQIDNSTESGLVISCGISLALYQKCVMEYVPTSLECMKMVPTPLSVSVGLSAFPSCPVTLDQNSGSKDTRDATVQYEERKRVLQRVSGCDPKGWLLCKQGFIRKELAGAALLPMRSPRFDSVAASAVDRVLRGVRREMHSEIHSFLPFSIPAGVPAQLSTL